jgi:hypothetical protein
MADAATLRRLALGLPGASEAAHFDRTAFRARTIFATLAPDGSTANLNLGPEEQAFRCAIAPHGFAPTPDAWGRKGWTRVVLAALDEDELAAAVEAAWRRSSRPAARRRKD